MTRQCWWLTVEALSRWFYRLRDYPSSVRGDKEGDGGIPPLKGARVDGTVLVVT